MKLLEAHLLELLVVDNGSVVGLFSTAQARRRHAYVMKTGSMYGLAPTSSFSALLGGSQAVKIVVLCLPA